MKILLYDPAIASINTGDHIISESARKQLHFLLENSHILSVSTHLPIGRFYFKHFMQGFDYKFVLGSNLLMGRLNGRFRQWDINYLNAGLVGPTILVGVGWWSAKQTWNCYTKAVYKRVLHPDFLHSVRDRLTEEKMREMGFENVINTGCPTTWSLTPEHCSGIPATKSDTVICTLTDYMPEPKRDRDLLMALREIYTRICFWPQGLGDCDYLKELSLPFSYEVLAPSLAAFDHFLEQEDCDYVGTRLHGGIRALQHGRRSLVVAIDHRAEMLGKDIGLPVVLPEDISALSEWIYGLKPTKIHLPTTAIELFKQQFKKLGNN